MNGTVRLAALGLALGAACVVAVSPAAHARNGALNPDTLSFFEEPLAFELLGFTATYNQLVDIPLVYDLKTDDAEFYPRINALAGIERQFANAVTLGASYFLSFDDREADEFEDRWGIYASGVWGRISAGEVNQTVREATRRWRGTGNADLEFDELRGTLSEDGLGVAYSLRISAATLNAGIDEHGRIDVGVTYERPSGDLDLRLTARVTRAEYASPNGITVFDTHAGAIVAQIERGSFAMDLGFGYEHFDTALAEGGRYFASAGVHYKVRRLTLSAEGHYGEVDGDREVSAALGARYDIARGLSFNLGYNFARSNADIDGIAIQNIDTSELIASVRYEF